MLKIILCIFAILFLFSCIAALLYLRKRKILKDEYEYEFRKLWRIITHQKLDPWMKDVIQQCIKDMGEHPCAKKSDIDHLNSLFDKYINNT